MENLTKVHLTPTAILEKFESKQVVTVELQVCVAARSKDQLSFKMGKCFKLFKFLVTNNEGKKVQCVGWEEFADFLEQKIQCGQVIRLNNVTVNSVSDWYNYGNCNYKLVFRPESKLEILHQLS